MKHSPVCFLRLDSLKVPVNLAAQNKSLLSKYFIPTINHTLLINFINTDCLIDDYLRLRASVTFLCIKGACDPSEHPLPAIN
jgi:hypothetical protein